MKKSPVYNMESTESRQLLNSIYLDAKNDYRASINLEQSILSFGVAILAICTAAGFTLFGKKESWIIFAIVIPFFLSLVNILFLHQKHRSKTYKAFILELEKKISVPYAFERWKQKNISKFVSNRIGFYICLVCILFMVSPLFIGIAFLSFTPADKPLWYALIGVIALILISDFVCIRYASSIRKLNK